MVRIVSLFFRFPVHQTKRRFSTTRSKYIDKTEAEIIEDITRREACDFEALIKWTNKTSTLGYRRKLLNKWEALNDAQKTKYVEDLHPTCRSNCDTERSTKSLKAACLQLQLRFAVHPMSDHSFRRFFGTWHLKSAWLLLSLEHATALRAVEGLVLSILNCYV